MIADVLCLDEPRKAAVRGRTDLNGIDFVEVVDNRETAPQGPLELRLEVLFLNPAPAGLTREDFRIEGGTRIQGIRVRHARTVADDPHRLDLELDKEGDFSTYVLRIEPRKDLDPRLSAAAFRFRSGCPSELDGRQERECPREPLDEPVLDYLAKDYASFRRLLLDLIPQRNPGWLERNPADLGMALVELLAYQGDQLSYLQDAVATEAYLDTCRHRVSARRHARLIDYRMHDGRNAWTFVQMDVEGKGTVPPGTRLLTRVAQPLRGEPAPPEVEIGDERKLDWDGDPALQGAAVFETTAGLKADARNNEMRVHTWSDSLRCLPRGATSADLYAVDAKTQTAVLPTLTVGDYLLFEEVQGPATGRPADADPAHRQVVRLSAVTPAEDPVFQPPLPLLHVVWREADALRFPLCLLPGMSLARGNVIPCDHGRTIFKEELPLPSPAGCRSQRLETRLSRGPLTFQAMPPEPVYEDDGRLAQDRHDLAVPTREAQPAAVLTLQFPAGETEIWRPVPDLLDSGPLDQHFVAEVDNDGRAILRFGDNEHGHRPGTVERVTARYRIGNGRAGNVGRGALAHLVRPPAAQPEDGWPGLQGLRQPLPAVDGTDPETIEEVRQHAPQAFQAETLHAVTEADYETAARKLPEVAAARCTFRWTGSWLTVFVTIEPRDPSALIIDESGRARLSGELEAKVRAHLLRFQQAGRDLEVCAAQEARHGRLVEP